MKHHPLTRNARRHVRRSLDLIPSLLRTGLCAIASIATASGQAPAAKANFQGWKYSGTMALLTTPEGADLPASASETNFPVLVRLDKDWFDFSQAKPKGEDLRFATPAGIALACQIDDWDAANGSAAVWVRIPTIKGNERQEIKVYWGKPDATTEANSSSVFHTANGYASVIHMDEALKDELGTVTPVDAGTTVAPGMVGKARHFVKGKGIGCGKNIKGYPFGDAPFTSEVWFRAEEAGSTVTCWGRYAKRFNGNTGDGNLVNLTVGSPPSLSWNSDGPGGATAALIPAMGKWYHLAATYENGTSRIYVNGKPEGVNESKKATMSLMDDIYMDIGGHQSFGFAGDIDEVRVSRVARSADWLKLQYANQNPMQTLVGPMMQKGADFAVSQTAINLLEGKSTTVTAKAGGAQKLYWILKQDGVESIAAVDRFSFIMPAGRVTKDTSLTLQLKAVFPNGTKIKDIPVTIKEDIPEPVLTLTAPPAWNGRDTIEVVPNISNLPAMKAKGAGELKTSWTITGGAVIKEVTPGKLILKRSQYTGKITVNAKVNNGGAETPASATVLVTEPKQDAWVQRVPAKDEKPEANQFYARDDKNEGSLFYNGTLEQPADTVFLKLYADDKLVKTDTQKPKPDKSYAFTAKLKPGMIQYKVEFGTKTGSSEKTLDTVNHLICGDAYVIDGQSNAEATGPNNGPNEDPPTAVSEWIRSFGNQLDGSVKGGWGNAVRTHIWGKPNYGDHQIGTWGMVLATELVTKYKIPVCFLNGAYGGTPIWHHQRNPENPFDTSGAFYVNPYKIYGGLLTRVTAAKLTHGIRGVFWFQGENDSGSGAPTGDWNYKSYQQYFIDMSAAWKQDYPNIKNYYVYQVWPMPCSMGPKDDGIREAQRTLPNLYSNLRTMSIIGAANEHAGRGSCHFALEDYAKFARFMCPLVEQDHYGLKPAKEVTAPNLKRAWFTSASRNEIALDFGQPMAWKDECIAWFELGDALGLVKTGKAAGNVITLQLGAPATAKTIAYCTGKNWDGKPDKLLFGTNGIAALTFTEVPIETAAK